MTKKLSIFLFCLILLGLALPADGTAAQEGGRSWSAPFRLSDPALKADQTSLISDRYGFTHVFWTETLTNGRLVLKYTRYDGEVWKVPIGIYISAPDQDINGISPVIDENAILHVYWAEGVVRKFIRYKSVPVREALSAAEWSETIQVPLVAETLSVEIAPDGLFHMMLTRIDPGKSGVYHTTSLTGGATWSVPEWLDPNIAQGNVPDNFSFSIDERGGLHALWNYTSLELGAEIDQRVRYARRGPEDARWTFITMDEVIQESEEEYQLNAAGPVMSVTGSQVLVIWAGGDLHYRHFRHSNDYGETWTDSVRIFGDLNGQAGDGMTVDGAGRVHYFTQIRYPVAIYHAMWDGARWTAPEIVYFIRYNNELNDNVEAHFLRPTVLAGNELVLTFMDEPPAPKRGLYITITRLGDIPAFEPESLPDPFLLPTAIPTTAASAEPAGGTPTGETTATSETAISATEAAPASGTAEPTASVVEVGPPETEGPQTNTSPGLIAGFVLSLLVVIGIVVVRMFSRR